MSKQIFSIGACCYCDLEHKILRGTPFIADIPAKMCRGCWDNTKKEYADSNDEHIPSFEDGDGWSEIQHTLKEHKENMSFILDFGGEIICPNCSNAFDQNMIYAWESGTCPYCGFQEKREIVFSDTGEDIENRLDEMLSVDQLVEQIKETELLNRDLVDILKMAKTQIQIMRNEMFKPTPMFQHHFGEALRVLDIIDLSMDGYFARKEIGENNDRTETCSAK